jgi:hypothetical protein
LSRTGSHVCTQRFFGPGRHPVGVGTCRGRHESESCRLRAAAREHGRTRLGDHGRRGRWLRRLYARPTSYTPEQVSKVSLSRRRTALVALSEESHTTSPCRGRPDDQPGPGCDSPPTRDPLTTSNNGWRGLQVRPGPRATAARAGRLPSVDRNPPPSCEVQDDQDEGKNHGGYPEPAGQADSQ